MITISCPSASRKYLERSSFTFASATRFARGPLSLEPRVGLRLWDDSEDLDGVFLDVIQHLYLVDAQAVLRPSSPRSRLMRHIDVCRWRGIARVPAQLSWLDRRRRSIRNGRLARIDVWSIQATTQQESRHNGAACDAGDGNGPERRIEGAVHEGAYAHQKQPEANRADSVLLDDDLSHEAQSTRLIEPPIRLAGSSHIHASITLRTPHGEALRPGDEGDRRLLVEIELRQRRATGGPFDSCRPKRAAAMAAHAIHQALR